MKEDITFEDDKDIKDLSFGNGISFVDDDEETTEDVVLPKEEEKETTPEETTPIKEETTPEEVVPATEETITEETTTPETETETETEDDVDLDTILDGLQEEIDDSNKELEKISEVDDPVVNASLGLLKDSLTKMEQQLKKINSEKMDLQFRNAELEAFGIDGLDPKLLSLSRVYAKAVNGDDVSKDKAIKISKEILFGLTGEDIDTINVSSDIDLLTQAELYNNSINPNLKDGKEEEDFGMLEL